MYKIFFVKYLIQYKGYYEVYKFKFYIIEQFKMIYIDFVTMCWNLGYGFTTKYYIMLCL